MNIIFAEQLRAGVQRMVDEAGYTASVAHAQGDTYTVTLEREGQSHSRDFDPHAGIPLYAWARDWLQDLEGNPS